MLPMAVGLQATMAWRLCVQNVPWKLARHSCWLHPHESDPKAGPQPEGGNCTPKIFTNVCICYVQQEVTSFPPPKISVGCGPAQRSSWTRCSDYTSNLSWTYLGVEPAALFKVAEKCGVFLSLLGQLFPWYSPEEKRAWKWMNEVGLWKVCCFIIFFQTISFCFQCICCSILQIVLFFHLAGKYKFLMAYI